MRWTLESVRPRNRQSQGRDEPRERLCGVQDDRRFLRTVKTRVVLAPVAGAKIRGRLVRPDRAGQKPLIPAG